MSKLDEILSRIDIPAFFPSGIDVGGERKIKCPYPGHKDDTPSFCVNLSNGLWKCHGCGKQGNLFTYARDILNKTSQDLAAEYGVATAPTIKQSLVDEYAKALKANQNAIDRCKNDFGWTDEALDRWQIGLDPKGRYTFPISDGRGSWINMRLYDPDKKKGPKIRSFEKGFGSSALWPMDIVMSTRLGDIIYVMEGEKDCLLALSLGLNAVTATGGAGTWNPQWSRWFDGLNVKIVYDIDRAGEYGSAIVANALAGIANDVRVVKLPIVDPPNADFTDYIIQYKNGIDNFKALVADAPPWKDQLTPRKGDKPDDITNVDLWEASQPDYFSRRVAIAAQVCGKEMIPYEVPREIRFTCNMTYNPQSCVLCPVGRANGDYVLELRRDDPELLQFIDKSEQHRNEVLKFIARIPQKCGRHKIELKSTHVVEEMLLIPSLSFQNTKSEHVQRKGYYVGLGIEASRVYNFTGVATSDPRSQHSVLLLYDSKAGVSSIDSFKLTPDIKAQLSMFKRSKGQSVAEKFDEIHAELEKVTRIRKRRELMTGVDLTFHSLIQFEFNHEKPKRGWVETLVIGDTRQGKSTTVEAMLTHYRNGEFGQSEISSRAGLVGGISDNMKHKTLTWGKFPLNDRGLFVIDEVSSISPEIIAEMSGMRASGVAEVQKTLAHKAHARTRSIWLSNTRSGNNLASYGQAVYAVKELIPNNEDIARFDVVVPLMADDVPLAEINKINTGNGSSPNPAYTSEACAQLVLWAWSRESQQVRFTPNAEKKIMEYSASLSSKYSNKIPILQAEESRIKLARLSVAAAARLFSTDSSGEIVVVDEDHVEFIHSYLELCYGKLRYDEFSRYEISKLTLQDENEVAQLIDGPVAEWLMSMPTFNRLDYASFKNIDPTATRLEFSILLKNRAIEHTREGYRKTNAFTAFLRSGKWSKKKAGTPAPAAKY